MTKSLSPRWAFSFLMSGLATAFSIGIWWMRYSWQSDYVADLLKVGTLVALSTAAIIFIMWTLTTRRAKATVFRGALAGVLTALLIIPLPALAWAFKTEFITLFQSGASGLFASAFGAVPAAINAGTLTFLGMTKVSLIAIFGSLAVGAGVAHFIPHKAKSNPDDAQN